MKKMYSNKLVILSLVLPGLVLFLFAILGPICLSVYYGLTNYSGIGKFDFIGLENYRNLMHDERACCYLDQNRYKNYEIAEKVGFRDEKYFAKVFKKVKGITPKEFRTREDKETV